MHGASNLHVYDYHIGNEPAGRPHRAPPQNDQGWVHFFAHERLVPSKFFPKKVDL